MERVVQSAAWGSYIFAGLGLFQVHAGCFISRFASTEYRRLNFGPLLSNLNLLLNQLWFKISQSLRAKNRLLHGELTFLPSWASDTMDLSPAYLPPNADV